MNELKTIQKLQSALDMGEDYIKKCQKNNILPTCCVRVLSSSRSIFRTPIEKWASFVDNSGVLNNNFEYLVEQNAELKQQLIQLNIQLADVREQLKQNNTSQTELKKQLNETSIELKSINASIATFSSQLRDILSYIPKFAKMFTMKFVQFYASIKTGTTDQLEVDFDDLPQLEHIS
jgi:DNA repair exonuclease SbcCD ATPase subunit